MVNKIERLETIKVVLSPPLKGGKIAPLTIAHCREVGRMKKPVNFQETKFAGITLSSAWAGKP
jgi:hypothetical protein